MLLVRSFVTGAGATRRARPPPRHLVHPPARIWTRTMADVKDSIPHVERTANDPRQTGMYNANISRVKLVNQRIRLIRLSLQKDGPPLRHLPGQYIDLHIPNVPVVGGFTITSPPQTAILHPIDPSTNQPVSADQNTSEYPCIDLAIQSSPSNPPAVYLWRDPPSSILNAPVTFRVGGNFTYPPATLSRDEFRKIQNVVFVAGGVGINPIMSMVSAMDLAGTGRLGGMVKRVRLLYSSKIEKNQSGDGGDGEEVLFEEQLRAIAQKYRDIKEVDFEYVFYETGAEEGSATTTAGNGISGRDEGGNCKYRTGRIRRDDLLHAVGDDVTMRKNTLVYVCGIPSMTDEFVRVLTGIEGMDEKRVLCEKWW